MTIFELVFIPSPGLSHLVSTVEAAKLLLSRDRRLSITVLIIMTSTTDQPTATYLSSAGPIHGLQLTNLPSPDRPPSADSGFFHSIASHAAGVREFLSGQISNPPSPNSRHAGLIVDMFCTNFIDIASELGLPSYVFFTSGACALGIATHLAGLKFDKNIDLTQFKDWSLELPVPCFSQPVPAKVLPAAFLQEDPLAATFLTFFRRVSDARGVMVNTFLELEPLAVRALQSDSRLPRVYPVGPILKPGGPEGREVVEWLDRQPDGSVVFLCFGTMGGFRQEQAAQIAAGLEASGARFLWSLRKPGPETKNPPVPTEYVDFREVLPEGFLERTEKIGKVIGWAPQVAVLGHRAVGGFVSHCGWNSVLESLWHGVPVAAFPQYAEQQVNAFLLVRELGLAEAVRIEYSTDFRGDRPPEIVAAPEIEAAVRRLMGSGGGVVREKVKELKMKSREAMEESKSAYEAQKSFIEDVIRNVGG